jgi:hypothetical protein
MSKGDSKSDMVMGKIVMDTNEVITLSPDSTRKLKIDSFDRLILVFR